MTSSTSKPTTKPTMPPRYFSDLDLATFNTAKGFKIVGAASGDKIGGTTAGDVNGDGYDDIIIGSIFSDPDERENAGTSYVIFCNKSTFADIDLANFPLDRGFRILGAVSSDYSGVVASAGDINGDGYSDIIIGAYGGDPDPSRSGAGISYVIFGKNDTFSDIDLATLTSTQGFKILGAKKGDFSGISVASAGYVNGDKYNDIIIGAYAASPNAIAYAGESYVIFGKENGFSTIDLASLSSSQGFKISGAMTRDYSGCTVDSAGDVNGDGYDDVIIGAYAGKSYVIFGKYNGFSNINLASLSSSEGFKILGTVTEDFQGYSVSSAGDINGDGFSDVIIGAYWMSPYSTRPQAGISYVIFGKKDGASTVYLDSLTYPQGFKILGAVINDKSGAVVNSAGDINGDGIDDIIIGASYADPNSKTDAGTSYVIFGKNDTFSDIDLAILTSTQGFKVLGAASYDYAGGVASAGDVNGDGYSDIIISAGGANSNSKTDAGILYVITDVIATISPTLTPTRIPTYSPTIKPSLIPTFFPTIRPSFEKNKIYNDIYLKDLIPSMGIKILGSSTNGYLGYSVSKIGDINKDGNNDIIVGAYGSSENSNVKSGVSYVIFGKKSGLSDINLSSFVSSQGFKILGDAANDYSGFSVSGAGDINGDGVNDIIIGAHQAAPNSREAAGTSYVIYGKDSVFSDISLATLPLSQGFKIYGAVAQDYSGYSVANAGDFNGDSYNDVVIGAYGVDVGAEINAGACYIIFGSKNNLVDIDLSVLNSTQGVKISGVNQDDYTGYAVNSAGDFNGDGYGDIIIGAYGSDPYGNSQSGASWLLYGEYLGFSNINLSALSTDKGFKINGEARGDQSGFAVASIGDINKDGYDDIIIGANLASPKGRTEAGTCYVIFGKKNGYNGIDLSNLLPEQGFKIFGAHSGDNLGISVNNAGDVNGDRIDDIIIGAYLGDYDVSSDTGISYIIYGKSSNFSDIDLSSFSINDGFKIVGVSSTDYSGRSVSGAGDVNGDGYDDILIGAYSANVNSQTDVGIAYLIMDASSTASPTMTPTIAPTLSIAPTVSKEASFSSSDIQESWHDGLAFKFATSGGSVVLSFIAGWILREKIAFYILNNWGYSYKLLYSDNKKAPLPEGEVGFRLAKNKNEDAEVVICKAKDKYLQVEVNNGNNNGISEGLYNTIFERLKQPHHSENFNFLESEKNQLRDFLLSHRFISLGDLGHIRGTMYNLCLGRYKTVHKEKYSHITRKGQDDFRLSDQNPLHDQIDFEGGNKQSGVEMRPSASNNLVVIENTKTANDDISNRKDNSMLLSIDAMVDPEHVRLQNEEFTRFGNQLINFINEVLSKDINLLLSSKSDSEPLLLEEAPKRSQTVMIYEGSAPADSTQFIDSNNLMVSLLNAKQVLHNLPLLHYVAQSSINYFGYNTTIPNPLDNKELLISVDLVLGNLAVQYLPAESIMNGIFISTASTASYAVKLIAADYLNNQEPSDNPIEFAQQCVSTIAAYALPGVVNYALTKAILPDAKTSISALDMLASSSFGVVQCYNNYKSVYSTVAKTTTTDMVPYIADAITLWNLRGYLNFDASSNTANLMMSIKNAMSVAATTYAVHCVSNMVMDVVPQEVKEEYVEPLFYYIQEVVGCSIDNINSAIGEVQNYCESMIRN